MKIIIPSLLISLLIALSFYSCDKEYATPPLLPPKTSFLPKFSDFNYNKAAGDSANWKFSAEKVETWDSLITIDLAIPVASYVEAVNNHIPVYQSDNIWQWEYSFTDLANNTYTAKLYGRLNTETVDWEMYISKEDSYLDFLWFTGLSLIDGSKVRWVLSDNPNSATELLLIEYYKGSVYTENLKYTNIVPDGIENSDYILYGNDRDSDLNAYYSIQRKATNNLIEIEWNQTFKNGRVKDESTFEDKEWHCWDENLQDIDCL